LKSNELDKEEERYIDRQNDYGWTALMQAAINGHLNSVLLLLHHGARVDIKNGWGATALAVASKGGSFGVVHTLINHGANVDQGGTEEVATLTPLMAAAQSGHLEIVRELLQAGAAIDVRLGSTGWTALMLAALNNQVSSINGVALSLSHLVYNYYNTLVHMHKYACTIEIFNVMYTSFCKYSMINSAHTPITTVHVYVRQPTPLLYRRLWLSCCFSMVLRETRAMSTARKPRT
jgi:hypothetical protein